MGQIQPELAEQFALINERVFDLKDIFSNMLYFDRRFGGSFSIKAVLPVLTNLSYQGMSISNGEQAADALSKMLMGNFDRESYEQLTNRLYEYCEQDTLAMVALFDHLCTSVGLERPIHYTTAQRRSA